MTSPLGRVSLTECGAEAWQKRSNSNRRPVFSSVILKLDSVVKASSNLFDHVEGFSASPKFGTPCSSPTSGLPCRGECSATPQSLNASGFLGLRSQNRKTTLDERRPCYNVTPTLRVREGEREGERRRYVISRKHWKAFLCILGQLCGSDIDTAAAFWISLIRRALSGGTPL